MQGRRDLIMPSSLHAGIACVRVWYVYLRHEQGGCVFRCAGECGLNVWYCKRGDKFRLALSGQVKMG